MARQLLRSDAIQTPISSTSKASECSRVQSHTLIFGSAALGCEQK